MKELLESIKHLKDLLQELSSTINNDPSYRFIIYVILLTLLWITWLIYGYDNFIEEDIEKVIKEKTKFEVDLSPQNNYDPDFDFSKYYLLEK